MVVAEIDLELYRRELLNLNPPKEGVGLAS